MRDQCARCRNRAGSAARSLPAACRRCRSAYWIREFTEGAFTVGPQRRDLVAAETVDPPHRFGLARPVTVGPHRHRKELGGSEKRSEQCLGRMRKFDRVMLRDRVRADRRCLPCGAAGQPVAPRHSITKKNAKRMKSNRPQVRQYRQARPRTGGATIPCNRVFKIDRSALWLTTSTWW